MTDDDLDALLTPHDVPPDATTREAIFARSARQLRRPRWRGIAKAAAVLGVGVAIGWFAKPTPPAPPPERVIETVIERVPVPVEVPSPAETLAEVTPDRLELEAEKATEAAASARLFQQAGDAYLKASKIESAIRCYRQHLAEAGADGRAVRADDTWLLTSLKNSKRTENDHANAGS
jgi:hypothetical protein